MDCSPPGSSVHGIFQVRNIGVGCHFFLQGIFSKWGSNLHLMFAGLFYHWATRGALKVSCSVAKSYLTLCNPMDCSTRSPCPSLPLRVCSHSCSLNQWCHPIILSPVTCFSFFINLPWHQPLFQWVGSLHHIVKVLDLQLQHQLFQWIFMIDFIKDWFVLSPFCQRNSQESSPAPQSKSINSLVLSYLYGPTFTYIHD